MPNNLSHEPKPDPAALAAHAVSIDGVASQLATSPATGLSEPEAQARLLRWGRNQLKEEPPVPAWKKLIAQFNDIVIWILIFAAVVSGLLDEWTDSLAIVAIVVLNGVIGFFQEARAEKALAALKRLSAPMAKVIRGGATRAIAASELVPGDLVELEAGDHVPADARLVQAYAISIQEAALTGESVPVSKDATCLLSADTSLGDRRNMIYLGTVIAAGKGLGMITATGMETELGRIAGLLQREQREPTPLQKRLDQMGKVLLVVCLAIVGVIFVLQVLRQEPLVDALMSSVSLAVAAVPEGLPAVVTIALALGLQRMVRRNALVRKLPSVETLGSVTVICSDKTGTLTRNEMTVREIVTTGNRYRVTGSGYNPVGEFFLADADPSAPPLDPRSLADLTLVLSVGAYCNNSKLVPSANSPDTWQILGDPTEGALRVAALKGRLDAGKQPPNVVFEIPFDSNRKAMSLVTREPDGQMSLYTKGAVEVVLDRCHAEFVDGRESVLTDERRRTILEQNSHMADRALRVLAMAYRQAPEMDLSEAAEHNLVFAGLVGMIDPPRDEARVAVQRCRQAGIRPVMITGDHPATALAIARELEIASAGGRVMEGLELQAINDEQLVAQVEEVAVFARATAEHKLRIVKALKSLGHVVAMTGDGVNDAPAVKAADIGIAMGITGTDVTKEASDMVLTDDNFASIVNAVEEGRGIYENIQKVLMFLLSCNTGEVLMMLVASLCGWPTPLLPIQLLWINLVTDGLPALALSLEAPEPDVMQRPPRDPRESILSMRIGAVILAQGVLDCIAALVAFGMVYVPNPERIHDARAVAFCVVVYGELFRALAARSYSRTLFQIGPFSNRLLILAIFVSGLLQLSVVLTPFTRHVFEISQHTLNEWFLIAVLALAPVTLIELAKLVRARTR